MNTVFKTSLEFTFLCLILMVKSSPVQGQTTVKQESELKLNEEAIRQIQFDFTPPTERKLNELMEAPIDKKWMKFKEDFSLPRSFTDTTKVKKIEGYVRAEPYTIWTKFGEDPVYDVMPNIQKKWEIHWQLNPFQLTEEYGRNLRPAPGSTYLFVTSPVGPSIVMVLDFDKLLYENLTQRGRAIKRNRKHANAWKIYKDYQPTAEDRAKFPNYFKRTKEVLAASETSDSCQYLSSHVTAGRNDSLTENGGSAYTEGIRTEAPQLTSRFGQLPTLPVYRTESKTAVQKADKQQASAPDSIPTDSIARNLNLQQSAVSDSVRQKHQPSPSPSEETSRFERYIRQQMQQDSIRRERERERGKGQRNAYDIEKEVRMLREKQN